MKQIDYMDTLNPIKLNPQYKSGMHFIEDSSEEVFDSELTFHGKPRKNKYPKNRKARVGIKYNTKDNNIDSEIKKESQVKLLTFAPEYTSIYTNSVHRSPENKYIYIDVYAVVDNRLYKLNNLVSRVMGKKLISRHCRFVERDVVRTNLLKESDEVDMDTYVYTEMMLIKELSKIMFGYDGGYLWQSMHKLYAYDVEKPVLDKKYVKREIKEDINKFRMR